ncbi:MAG: prolyl oligopeptidase family serine peptidase [Chloroflexi bacterium]|nr:prolyl oligopeptidase family serine peptidase [Chloroflexota bacterium]
MTQRTVEPADLFRLKFSTGAQLSPDGTRAAYTVYQVDGDKEKDSSAIWLVTLATGETRQLTNGAAKDSLPVWSPDGTQIAFVSTRGDKPQIYLIPVAGGEAQVLTSLPQGVGSSMAWSPNGTQIAFVARPQTEPRDPSKPYRVDRSVYRFDELNYLDDVAQSLYVISASGGEAQRLTDDRQMNNHPQWSPDGKEILFVASMNPDSFEAIFLSVHVVDATSGTIRTVIDGQWGSIGAAGWTPDGKKIVFAGTPNGKAIGSKSDLWVIDRMGGTPENRSAGLNVGVEGDLLPDMPVVFVSPKIIVARDGRHAYTQVQAGGTRGIYSVALSGEESCVPLVTGERACVLVSADAAHLLYLASDFNYPIDLYCCNPDGSDERQLTHLNDTWLAQVRLPEFEHLLFPGSDGVQVEGWFAKPPEGDAPYPTILFIHGGPHLGFGHIFHFDTQLLCGAGYAVLLVNHRASTGYGDDFSTAIKGDWGNLDYLDLMAGVDLVVARGLADPDRLGVTGRSGGGNLSCWIIGHTDRFKAAVPENPVTNWVSFYGVSDVGVWFATEQLGGHPWEIPEIYARCSPITEAHHCVTPTLMIQGEYDWRCPAEQSEQFYTVLKANGCTVEMLRFPNSSHGGAVRGPLASRTAHNDALLDWMNRYVLGK